MAAIQEITNKPRTCYTWTLVHIAYGSIILDVYSTNFRLPFTDLFGRIVHRACCSFILRLSVGFPALYCLQLSIEFICQPYWISALFRLLQKNLRRWYNPFAPNRLTRVNCKSLTKNKKYCPFKDLSLMRARRFEADGLYQRR